MTEIIFSQHLKTITVEINQIAGILLLLQPPPHLDQIVCATCIPEDTVK